MTSLHEVLPDDAHNREMLALVRPPGWRNPSGTEVYDVIAIGGGTAGMVATGGAAILGANAAMIERGLMGGDCLVTGCVPSKALLRAAAVAHEVRNAHRYGIRATAEVDFGAVMQRLREVRATIAHNDSAESFRARGVDVMFGHARFTGPRTVDVDGRALRFKRAVIATGARSLVPPIEGMDQIDVLTSDTLFELTEAPGHIALIGGGPLGCEMGQALARLGVPVTLLEMANRLLPLEDPAAGHLLADVLREEGVDVRLGARVVRIERRDDGVAVELQSGEAVRCDRVLVAVGRAPNVESLGLEAAGVRWDHTGVEVDRYQRTSNRRIYATGDVCAGPRFTHAAYAQSEYAVLNALFPVWFNARDRVVPRVTYTDPEVAHIGASWAELDSMGDRVRTLELPCTEIDRMVLEGRSRGFAKVHLRRGSDRILGATVVADGAGELIAELGLAMTKRLGLAAIGDTIHAYPTRSELVRKLADTYNIGRVTPAIRLLLKWWYRLL